MYLGGGIDKEISCINFCLNVWCGYCIQYNNYFLSVTITNGVCPLGAAHIHWLSWMPSLPGGLCGGYVGVSCLGEQNFV